MTSAACEVFTVVIDYGGTGNQIEIDIFYPVGMGLGVSFIFDFL